MAHVGVLFFGLAATSPSDRAPAHFGTEKRRGTRAGRGNSLSKRKRCEDVSHSKSGAWETRLRRLLYFAEAFGVRTRPPIALAGVANTLGNMPRPIAATEFSFSRLLVFA
jgi:hypothetical protein